MSEKKLILEGGLQMWDSEGGYASPTVIIDGEDLTELLNEFFTKEYRLHGEIGMQIPGTWRVTLERMK